MEGGKRLGLEVQTEDIEHTPRSNPQDRVNFEFVPKQPGHKNSKIPVPGSTGTQSNRIFLPLTSPLLLPILEGPETTGGQQSGGLGKEAQNRKREN